MARGQDDVEIIEVLPADHDLFPGPAGPAEPAGSSPPRRHLAVAGAVVAVVAVVAVSWWWPDSTDTPAAAATSTTGAALAPPSGHYVVSDPRSQGLQSYSADIVGPPSPRDEFQLWSDGAPDGTWILFETTPPSEPYAIVGGTRTVVGDREIVETQQLELVSFTEVTHGKESVTRIQASGVTDDELVAVADAVEVAGGRLGIGRMVARVDRPLRLVAKGSTPESLALGVVRDRVQYLTDDRTMVTLLVGDGDPDARAAVLPYLGPAGVSTGRYRTGMLRATGDTYVAWDEGTQLLTLTGALPVDQLLAIASTVVPTTDTTWRSMVTAAHPDYTLGDYVTVSTGTTATGEQWAAGLQFARRADRREYLLWWTIPGDPSRSASIPVPRLVDEPDTVVVVAVKGATYVFVAWRPDGEPARTINGVTNSFVGVGPFDDGLHLAVVRIDQPGQVAIA